MIYGIYKKEHQPYQDTEPNFVPGKHFWTQTVSESKVFHFIIFLRYKQATEFRVNCFVNKAWILFFFTHVL